MAKEDLIKDVFVRYRFILAKRYSKKEKEKAVRALEADLKSVRPDVRIDEFSNQGRPNKNLYVGNVKRANKIIATYYDTPSLSFGNYYPLKKEKTYRQSVLFNIVTSLAVIVLGLLYTLFVTGPIMKGQDLMSVKSILAIISYFVFFIILSKTARGIGKRRTLVRNSSSLFFLLTLVIDRKKTDNTAYAFLDSGCSNNAGIDRLRDLNKFADIYYLDSIGARETVKRLEIDHSNPAFKDTSLPDGINLMVAASYEDGDYLIYRDDLNSQILNEANLEALDQYL